MRRALILLLLLPGLVFAQMVIYKHVAEDGTVTYSDEPIEENSQQMDLPEISVVENERRPVLQQQSEVAGGEAPAAETTVYTRVEFISPEPDLTVWGPNAQVRAALNILPGLDANHTLRYFLDGKNVAETRNIRLQLEDLPRGAHQVGAQIIDAQGNAQASAQPVTFYVQQPSVIPPANPAPGVR